jgi:DNA recombination protein RmuC
MGTSEITYALLPVALAAVVSALALAWLRRSVETISQALRNELSMNRTEGSQNAALLRTETTNALSDARISTEAKLDRFYKTLNDFGEGLAQRHEQFREKIDTLVKSLHDDVSKMCRENTDQQTQLRERLRSEMEALRLQNDTKLDEIRGTVDERLQKTLEQRLGESFKLVSERLEQVHAGLGEMQILASNVGDLKRVLSNVKTRGVFGEVLLKALIQDILAPDQYLENADVGKGTLERVEFAIRMPGGEDGVLLPIDSKFPQEPYEALLNAYDAGDGELIKRNAESLGRAIKNYARSIEKYINPPCTTDFAVMFLPTEGLYSEVLRMPGFVDSVRRENRIVIQGPSTFAAVLQSLQVGFRTLVIEKRSSEVWQLLGGVKTEFEKFGGTLEKVKTRLERAQQDIGDVQTRARVINRRLRSVEALPEAESSSMLDIDDEAVLETPAPSNLRLLLPDGITRGENADAS